MKVATVLVTTIIFLLGMASPAYPGQNDGIVLLTVDVSESKAYQLYKSDGQIKSGEIKYLLHLVKHAKYKVIREGREYSSKQVARYLDLKFNLNARNINSAEQFIDRYASYSKKGTPIYVIDKDGVKHLARQILYEELRRLRNYVNQQVHRAKL